MRWIEIVENKVTETSTAGATASGNVATLVGNGGSSGKGAIGAGFDPSGHKGIYDAAEKKKGKGKKSK